MTVAEEIDKAKQKANYLKRLINQNEDNLVRMKTDLHSYNVRIYELEKQLTEKEYCDHNWKYIGHQANGHKECTKCGEQGDYN